MTPAQAHHRWRCAPSGQKKRYEREYVRAVAEELEREIEPQPELPLAERLGEGR